MAPERLEQREHSSGLAPDVDPFTTEVIRHGLEAAADQMRVALCRTAFSPVIYEMTDFAAALFDERFRLLAQARSLPSFLGTLGFCVESGVEKSGGVEALAPGDVIVTTYAYDTGSHSQDLVVIVPGFVGAELVGFAAIKAHHLDIGAKDPYCTDTTDLFQEGTIFPAVKLYRAGELQDDLYRTMVANSRLPEALEGDLAAQRGAALTGLEGLFRLIDRYGADVVRASIERIFDQGEQKVRAFIETLPDGRYVARGALDNDGLNPGKIDVELAVEIEGTNLAFDYTSAPKALPGPMNAPRQTTVSVSRLVAMALSGMGHSANEGCFRPIEIRTEPGTIFDPKPPTPCFMYGWIGRCGIDVMLRALSQALPHAVPARSGGDLCGFIYWGYEEDGELWADGADHAIGQGASAAGDAGAPLMHMSGSGIRNTPIEVIEARRPIVVERFGLACDSGGAGRFRGGLGVDIHYRALRELFVTLPWDQVETPPWGVQGGGEARANGVSIRSAAGDVEPIGKCTAMRIGPGEVLQIATGGGGGWGPASERDPRAVADDLLAGYISELAAHETYPQLLDGDSTPAR